MQNLEIEVDDLTGSEIAKFLDQHLAEMKSVSPAESCHALDLEELKQADVTFWSIRSHHETVGCGALKELDKEHAEIKSMRVSSQFRGQGIASKLLEHMIFIATKRGYKRISLETGSMAFFKPAYQLYKKYGFECCSPFASYTLDKNSVFMSKVLFISNSL